MMAKQIAQYDYHSLANLSASGTEALVLFKKGREHYNASCNCIMGCAEQ